MAIASGSQLVITVNDVPDLDEEVTVNAVMNFIFKVSRSGFGEVTIGSLPKVDVNTFLTNFQQCITDDYLNITGFSYSIDTGLDTITLTHVDYGYFDNATTTAPNLSLSIENGAEPEKPFVEQAKITAKASGNLTDARRYLFLLGDGGISAQEIKTAQIITKDFAGTTLIIDSELGVVDLTLDTVENLKGYTFRFVAYNDVNGINILTSNSEEIRQSINNTITSDSLINGDVLELYCTGEYFQVI